MGWRERITMRRRWGERVKIVESPRMGWQSLPKAIPAEVQADFLRLLLAAGFEQLDAVSFVGVGADSDDAAAEKGVETVLGYLSPPRGAELLALVADARGAEAAVRTGVVSTLLFSYSIAPGFLDRHQRQTPEEALEALEQVGEIAYKAGAGCDGEHSDGVWESVWGCVGHR